MKKTNLIFGSAVVLTSLFFGACTSSSEKVENAQEEVTEANQNLEDANEEYRKDYASYKEEVANRITYNEQIIIDFKERVKLQKDEAKADYDEKIEALNQKNSDLRKRMDDYTVQGKESWEAFKTEFDRDMDELGEAFKNLNVNNVK
ncbi:hypothetical protein [Aurantibacillus circumpalustris]|uniref:hypothetical protein n=1 Tax=Aurantibacillus circumpalustris TaxID=3036359 RepID=UPI00295B6778|nr:hypothetical protein [Aurantibacillus circumpalustris]